MNLNEKNQVMDFLKKKNLSYPLFKELYDHFLIDIDEEIINGKGFQEAFLNTKIKWQNELELVKVDAFSFKKVPRIEARILGTHFRNIIKIAGLTTMLTLLFSLLSEEISVFIVLGLVLLTFGIFLYLFLSKRLSFFSYIKLSFHPLILKPIALSLFFISVSGYISNIHNIENIDVKMMIQNSIIVYNSMIQIQLLLLQNKKINVLLS